MTDGLKSVRIRARNVPRVHGHKRLDDDAFLASLSLQESDGVACWGAGMPSCWHINNNLAIANRSRVNCTHNTLRASIGINITPQHFSHFADTQHQRMAWPWNLGLGSFKVIENGAVRQSMYDFLLVRHCNYSFILYRLRVIWRWILSWPWNVG